MKSKRKRIEDLEAHIQPPKRDEAYKPYEEIDIYLPPTLLEEYRASHNDALLPLEYQEKIKAVRAGGKLPMIVTMYLYYPEVEE